MKLKQTIIVLAALSIIALGALLPELTARRQDRQDMDTVLFTQVEGVELEFAQSDLTRSETLAILVYGRDMVEIPQELTTLKQEKAEKTAMSAVEKYRDAGILLGDPEGDVILYSQAMLYYGLDNQSNVYWLVHIGDKEGDHTFGLILDDRTGAVCSMEYSDYSGTYPVEQMEEVLRSFCQIYLTGLGEEFYGWSVEELAASAKSPQDKSYLATELQWDDPAYGRTRITFFVNPGGFYTYFDKAAQ